MEKQIQKIKVISRQGIELGFFSMEFAKKILVMGQGTFHYEDGEYVFMLWL